MGTGLRSEHLDSVLMTSPAKRIAENYQTVMARVAEATVRSDREPGAVMMVAVTKYVDDVELLRPLVAAGCHELAESRPQQLWAKAEQLGDDDVRWHLVGHLQRNKVARTLRYTSLIQSVDSLRLLRAINEAATTPCDVLLEVNISGDENKHGFRPGEMAATVAAAAEFPQVHIRGLMAMAALHGDSHRARSDFVALRELRDVLAPAAPDGVELTQLSMGMTRDFEVAIEEGATIVRIGRALFDGVLP